MSSNTRFGHKWNSRPSTSIIGSLPVSLTVTIMVMVLFFAKPSVALQGRSEVGLTNRSQVVRIRGYADPLPGICSQESSANIHNKGPNIDPLGQSLVELISILTSLY